jgi:hypothetical protein
MAVRLVNGRPIFPTGIIRRPMTRLLVGQWSAAVKPMFGKRYSAEITIPTAGLATVPLC